MKKWLFNPFQYIAGARALLAGMGVMLATAAIAMYSYTHFDGAIDLHTGRITPAWLFFAEPLIDWLCCIVPFYFAGIFFSRSSVRLIDVAGTFALARWVMIFPAIISFGMHTPDVSGNINDLVRSVTPATIALALLEFVFLVWMIALMFNAFSVSCNMKGGKAVAVFIITLVIAEVLSKIIFHLTYKQFISIQ